MLNTDYSLLIIVAEEVGSLGLCRLLWTWKIDDSHRHKQNSLSKKALKFFMLSLFKYVNNIIYTYSSLELHMKSVGLYILCRNAH